MKIVSNIVILFQSPQHLWISQFKTVNKQNRPFYGNNVLLQSHVLRNINKEKRIGKKSTQIDCQFYQPSKDSNKGHVQQSKNCSHSEWDYNVIEN